MSYNYVDIQVNFSNQDELNLAIEKIRLQQELLDDYILVTENDTGCANDCNPIINGLKLHFKDYSRGLIDGFDAMLADFGVGYLKSYNDEDYSIYVMDKKEDECLEAHAIGQELTQYLKSESQQDLFLLDEDDYNTKHLTDNYHELKDRALSDAMNNAYIELVLE